MLIIQQAHALDSRPPPPPLPPRYRKVMTLDFISSSTAFFFFLLVLSCLVSLPDLSSSQEKKTLKVNSSPYSSLPVRGRHGAQAGDELSQSSARAKKGGRCEKDGPRATPLLGKEGAATAKQATR